MRGYFGLLEAENITWMADEIRRGGYPGVFVNEGEVTGYDTDDETHVEEGLTLLFPPARHDHDWSWKHSAGVISARLETRLRILTHSLAITDLDHPRRAFGDSEFIFISDTGEVSHV